LVLTAIESLTDKPLNNLIHNSKRVLYHLDLSFMTQKTMKDTAIKIGNCPKLETLILSGSNHFDDAALVNIVTGEDAIRKPEGFSKL